MWFVVCGVVGDLQRSWMNLSVTRPVRLKCLLFFATHPPCIVVCGRLPHCGWIAPWSPLGLQCVQSHRIQCTAVPLHCECFRCRVFLACATPHHHLVARICDLSRRFSLGLKVRQFSAPIFMYRRTERSGGNESPHWESGLETRSVSESFCPLLINKRWDRP